MDEGFLEKGLRRALQVDFVRSVMAGDHLREEEHMALETLLANVPQSRTVKSNSLELTPSNTPQLSPATTPANKKNRLPIGTLLYSILHLCLLVFCFFFRFSLPTCLIYFLM